VIWVGSAAQPETMKAVMQLIAASLVEASATGQYEGVRAALRRESIFVKIVLAPGLSYIHTLAQRRDPKDVIRASDLQPTSPCSASSVTPGDGSRY
jgi:hypothetical protein